jgi:hypothetical protein
MRHVLCQESDLRNEASRPLRYSPYQLITGRVAAAAPAGAVSTAGQDLRATS